MPDRFAGIWIPVAAVAVAAAVVVSAGAADASGAACCGSIAPPTAAVSPRSAAHAPGQSSAPGDWRQWGGPSGDFSVDGAGLAETWPEEGPQLLWRRGLGPGYSTIVVDGSRLFTMYRRGGEEVVVAIDADSGSTLWEYAYDVSLRGFDVAQGSGPHSSPLVHGQRLFTVGFVGDLNAFDKRTGEPLWSVNLWHDLDGTVRPRGYSSSPIAYRDTIILPVGGRGRAVVAFDPEDGAIVWSGGDFQNAHATPIIIDVDGDPQLVAFMVDYVAGLDPRSGELLWRHPHRTDYGLNISTPIWGRDNLLFVSSAYSGGSRALRLSLQGVVTRVEQVWFTNQLRVHFGNGIRIGDHMYAANGDFGPSFVTALDMTDGSIVWRDRSFAKASFVRAGDRLIVLDEDGVLGLVTVSPMGMEVAARADILSSRSWTVPTLAGTRLYARDLEEIVAIDLSAATNARE